MDDSSSLKAADEVQKATLRSTLITAQDASFRLCACQGVGLDVRLRQLRLRESALRRRSLSRGLLQCTLGFARLSGTDAQHSLRMGDPYDS